MDGVIRLGGTVACPRCKGPMRLATVPSERGVTLHISRTDAAVHAETCYADPEPPDDGERCTA